MHMFKNIRQLLSLTNASLKMFYRNKTALFFSIFVPILIIVIFGVLLNNNGQKTTLGVVDLAQNTSSKAFIQALNQTKTFTIAQGNQTDLINKLKQGDEDIVISIPASFNVAIITRDTQNTISAYYDKSKAQSAQAGLLILSNILTRYNETIYTATTGQMVPQSISLQSLGIETKNLGGIDFLIPGIMAMSIMQLGLFSVAFAFTSMKKTGALRRLHATPAKPSNFIIAQSISRLILTLVQVGILLGIGIYAFKLHMYGNIFSFMAFVLLGAITFLSFGFAIAGYAKDENQAAPIANLVSLPLLFLSGVFFPRSLMPELLKNITSYLPLTYLTDALREIANNGTSITHLTTDLLGLLIWCVLGIIVAVKLFKWE